MHAVVEIKSVKVNKNKGVVDKGSLRYFLCSFGLRAITKGKTLVPVCSPKLSPLDGVDIWMGDHLSRIPCTVLLGKSGWRSGL